MPSDVYAELLAQRHERRLLEVEHAWYNRVGSSERTRCLNAWETLGLLGDSALDANEFLDSVERDFEHCGVPCDCPSFCLHYNRMLVRRERLFLELYAIGNELGEGGFSRVMKGTRMSPSAMRPGHQKDFFALKLVRKEENWARRAELLDAEISIWSRVKHQSCVRLFGTYETANMTVLVAELCVGGCLLDLLIDIESFTERQAQQISIQVANAVVYLHSIGIVHRDIKSDNVLCTDRQPHLPGHVKLADFGFAAEFERGASGLTRLLGTPEYTAPEIVRALITRKTSGAQIAYDERVDFWSLGCLVFELLAGEPPFLSEDDDEQYHLTLHAQLAFPQKIFGNVSSNAVTLLCSLLQKDPLRRLSGEQILEAEWLNEQLQTPRAIARPNPSLAVPASIAPAVLAQFDSNIATSAAPVVAAAVKAEACADIADAAAAIQRAYSSAVTTAAAANAPEPAASIAAVTTAAGTDGTGATGGCAAASGSVSEPIAGEPKRQPSTYSDTLAFSSTGTKEVKATIMHDLLLEDACDEDEGTGEAAGESDLRDVRFAAAKKTQAVRKNRQERTQRRRFSLISGRLTDVANTSLSNESEAFLSGRLFSPMRLARRLSFDAVNTSRGSSTLAHRSSAPSKGSPLPFKRFSFSSSPSSVMPMNGSPLEQSPKEDESSKEPSSSGGRRKSFTNSLSSALSAPIHQSPSLRRGNTGGHKRTSL
mmetsp:Transcript_2643/g.4555  ORF Transcript_2643/g.4555 Transcript_2643/m.4555 type:complete len:710 (-) Transcript_2643:199-2328(-)